MTYEGEHRVFMQQATDNRLGRLYLFIDQFYTISKIP